MPILPKSEELWAFPITSCLSVITPDRDLWSFLPGWPLGLA
jgi:hypothetical protein